MSCDLVEIRLNNGLVISLHDDSHTGWLRDRKVTEREMWQRMANIIQNTDFEAVKRLYGTAPPDAHLPPVRLPKVLEAK
jgi:hypothetical protein